MDETFLIQVIDDSMRGGVPLDRIFRNRKEVLGKVKSGSNLDCCEQETVDFTIPRGENKANSMVTILIVVFSLLRRIADP